MLVRQYDQRLRDSNEKDVDELPDYLLKGLTFHFARDFGDVYRWAFKK